MIFIENNQLWSYQNPDCAHGQNPTGALVGYSQVALKSDSDLAELGGKGYVKFDLSAREFDLCAR